MPGVATIVVVQSDDLAAWIGVAGVAVGVVLGAGIDSWRSRKAERKRLRRDLTRAGTELAHATTAWARANRAAGEARNEAAWVEVIDARGDAWSAAMLTIRGAGVAELDKAALQVAGVALKAPPDSEPEAVLQHAVAQGAALDAYWDVVRKAKL